MISQLLIPELGNFALAVALFLALLQGVLPIVGAARGNAVLMSVARPISFGHFTFVTIAFICLLACFINSDFVFWRFC